MRKILTTVCMMTLLFAAVAAYAQGIPKDHAAFQKSIGCVPVGFSQVKEKVITMGAVQDPAPLAAQGFKDVAQGDAIVVSNDDGKWMVTLRKTKQTKSVPFKRGAFGAFIDKMQN